MYLFSLTIVSLIIVLCTTIPQDANKSVIKNKTSIFSDFDEIGIKKESFIVKFGNPTNKDMLHDDNNNLIETLYYAKILDNSIAVITKFTFKNNILTEQKNEEISFPPDNHELKMDIQFIRHQMKFK